jgi:hypothetical protein
MLTPSIEQLVDAVQARWRPIWRLGFLRRPGDLPPWALSAAHAEGSQLPRARYGLYRAQMERHALACAMLYARWCVALVLAALVAALMGALALAVPIQDERAGVLLGAVAMVMLPPLAIYWRLACEYAASRALTIALSVRLSEDR